MLSLIRPLFFHKIILSAFLLAVYCHSKAQLIDMLDSDNGFFGLTFGKDIRDFPTLKHSRKALWKHEYINPNDSLSFLQVKFYSVHYIFYKNQLHSIRIKIEGDEMSQRFLAILKDYYGEGEQAGRAPRYYWKGKLVYLVYDQNLLTQNTEVRFESVLIQRELEKDYNAAYE
ncbi:MAG: hypothetical protein LC115_03765 [Bacteroidia bacterium]|nr:hypothetical protein [Bacteroidia bacterium]